MKVIKALLLIIVIIGIGIGSWLYYPQYKINSLKKQTLEVSMDTPTISYIDFFRESDSSQIYHLAIGDSIIRGVGAKQNEDFVYQFSTRLGSHIGKEILYDNKGINGITSTELNKLVQEGQFDEEIQKSNIITINVGGNDILRIANGQSFSTVFQSVDQIQSSFSTNLTEITNRITILNPNATIVILELYNPLSPDDHFYALADKLLPNWNLTIYEVANQHSTSIVVETTKVINRNSLQNLAPDGVHPNSAGYLAISEQMILQFMTPK